MELFNTNEELFNDLVIFLKTQIGAYNKPITRKTLIEDELGITGDDAEDLLTAFSKRYKIDISKFDFTKYFYDEPVAFNFQNRKIEALTVGHLEKGILAGRLDEDVINSSSFT